AAGNGSKGGGVYYGGGDNPLLEGNTVYSNTAEDGGGLYLTSGSPRVWNNVIHHNAATKQGGGLYAGGSPQVWNTTFYSNTAEDGGGLYLLGGAPVVSNTIIAANHATATGGGIYQDGGTPALAYNDVWGNTPNDYFGTTAGTGSISADPRFLDPAAPDLHLTRASPCIDAGDPSTTLAQDRDGAPRPQLDGYDIGAYEYALTGAVYAPATADPGGLITYTVAVTNVGPLQWTVPVTDALHPYLDFVSITATVGTGEYVTATHTISWTGPVAGNSTVYITFTTRVTGWVAAGSIISNQAWVDHGATDVVTTTINALPGARYVATTGTDTDNNCLLADHPCRTVQWGVNQALTGDQVRVASGTYTDTLGAGQVVSLSTSISLIGGYTSTTWTYDPVAYPTYLDGGSSARSLLITGPVTVTVAGFHVVSGTQGVVVQGATATISRCRIYNHTNTGIAASSGSLTLQRSWVYENGGNGVELIDSSYRLENTVIAHNNGAGLHTASAAGQLLHTTFARNSLAGAVVDGTATFTNTIFYSHTVGISVTSGSLASLEATLWYSNTANQTAGTLISSTNIYSNPAFIDPDGMNYHIRGDSPALNAGVWVGLGEDVDGDTRPAGLPPDIGADQYPLRVARWASPAVATPCQVVAHTLRLTDLRAAPFSTVRLTDTLDANASWAGTATATAGSAGYVAAGHAVTWTGPVAATAPTFITYTARITPYLTAGTRLTHTATVSDDLSLFDGGSSTVTVTTLAAELAQEGPGQAAVGEVVTYTATFTVPAGHAAYRPLVVVTLPRLVTGSGLSTTPALTYVVGSAN
ncbi:MAG TPA: DUF11 domain-containing protein, partial [Anaerolineae bacterium]|nr:DUF11 domain-containing protein [Anaerolineae bacterium]